jgi:hypothetical protein
MKIFLLSLLCFLQSLPLLAQQASDYFPAQTGYKWNYKVIPLDSANNEIDSLTYSRADSFAVNTDFMGMNAELVLSKNGPQGMINYIPYTDSTFFSFQNSNAYQYFRVSNLGNLITVLDSIGLDSTVLGIIQSFEDWYSVFRFSQSVGDEYTIFTKDTTISFNGSNIPLRFEMLAKRLADETVQTEAGTFVCKKFLVSYVVSYILFPPITIELVRLETTKWFSTGVWLVQEYAPSKTIDLSYIGFGTFNVPGSKTELVSSVTDVKYAESVPSSFELYQNYPNPFNPSTTISFSIPETGNVSLKVYDIIGREVSTLINEQKNAGSYAVAFNPENIASGVYFYILKFKGMQISHKMLYLK